MSCDRQLRHYTAIAQTCDGPCFHLDGAVEISDFEIAAARSLLDQGVDLMADLDLVVGVIEVVTPRGVLLMDPDRLAPDEIDAARDSIAAQAAAHWLELTNLTAAWRAVQRTRHLAAIASPGGDAS